MRYLKKILCDFVGLLSVCGATLACKWMLRVCAHVPAVIRRRNLQPADRAMGVGPFRVRPRGYSASFRIKGTDAFSGIREMYVRDTYLHKGILAIRDGDFVLDLGANMGNFTNLALAQGRGVRVFAVEPSKRMNEVFKESVGLNPGHLERTMLISAFVGLMADLQQSLTSDADYADAKWMSEDELISAAGIDHVDFLKCDIEGGEFGLLSPTSELLKMAKSIAVEIHSFAGDVEKFIQMLRNCGFEILAIQRDPDGTSTVLARRAAVS